VQHERVSVAAQFDDYERRALRHQAGDKVTSRESRSSLETRMLQRALRAACSAAAS